MSRPTSPLEGEVGEGEARTGRGVWVIMVLFALAALPLIGHGCHGDDVDHEPSVPPTDYTQR